MEIHTPWYTDFELLVYSTHKKEWNWNELSCSPLISQNFIESNLDFPWNWNYISKNKNITFDFILKFHTQLDWTEISRLDIITWPIVVSALGAEQVDCAPHMSRLNANLNLQSDLFMGLNSGGPWDWWYISRNSSVTWDIIEANPSLPWVWRSVTSNPNITVDIILNNLDLSRFPSHCNKNCAVNSFHSCKGHWGLNDIRFKNITWEQVESNINLPWPEIFHTFSSTVPWDKIELYIDKNWSWSTLSKRLDINWNIVIKYFDKPWHWATLLYNPTITIEFIRFIHSTQKLDDYYFGQKDSKQSWITLTKNIGITWNTIQENADLPWSWKDIGNSNNCNMFDKIKIDYKGEYEYISQLDMGLELFADLPHYLKMDILSSFTKYFTLYQLNFIK